MPGLRVIRPADANETAAAWRIAVDRDGPTALVLSRQDLPVLEGTAGNDGVARGAYVLRADVGPVDARPRPHRHRQRGLRSASRPPSASPSDGIAARVVSMPSWELFDEQDETYQDDVLPAGRAHRSPSRPASSFGWDRWADAAVAIDRFGASAPGAWPSSEFGFTADNVAEHGPASSSTTCPEPPDPPTEEDPP